MPATRRDILKSGGRLTLFGLMASIGLLKPAHANTAWNKAAFSTKDIDSTIAALGGKAAAASADIQITAATIAENGQVVPVRVVSKIPNTKSIAILIERNPATLAAIFDIFPGTEPAVSTRVKMAQTSNVHALVEADGKFYTAKREIKVTLGGC